MRTLIGSRCTHGNMFSRGVLITYVSLKHFASYVCTYQAGMFKSLDSLSTAAVLLRLSARHRFLGDYSAGVPPLPIPNRAVKPRSADGTAIRWESRSSPSPCEPRHSRSDGALFLVQPTIAKASAKT